LGKNEEVGEVEGREVEEGEGPGEAVRTPGCRVVRGGEGCRPAGRRCGQSTESYEKQGSGRHPENSWAEGSPGLQHTSYRG